MSSRTSRIERHEAEAKLLAQLDYGRRAADERGALTTDQVRGIFAERFAQGVQMELAWSPAAVDDLNAVAGLAIQTLRGGTENADYDESGGIGGNAREHVPKEPRERDSKFGVYLGLRFYKRE